MNRETLINQFHNTVNEFYKYYYDLDYQELVSVYTYMDLFIKGGECIYNHFNKDLIWVIGHE